MTPKLLLSVLLFCLSCQSFAQSKPAATHVVEKGETLYSIGKKYHVTVEALESANKSNLGENYKLKIGQKLTIPSSSAHAPGTAAKKPAPSAPKSPKPAAVAVSAPPKSGPKPAAVAAASSPPVHIVAKGETVYAIAKANGLTAKQIKDANHLPDDMKLKLGQKLIIPSKNPEAMYKPAPKEASPDPVADPKPQAASAPATEQGRDYMISTPSTPENHPVKQETIEPVKPVEHKPAPAPAVQSASAQDAQGDENPFLPRPVEAKKHAPAAAPGAENINPDDYPSVFDKYNDSGMKKVIYRGIGMFMENENPGNQYLALYNYADMGSILKVTNLMSKEVIYVKVVGKVTALDAQKDVILKISNEAANKLKIKEDRFLVEVTGYNMQ